MSEWVIHVGGGRSHTIVHVRFAPKATIANHYLSVAIYAARSAASVRESDMFGILGCGSSKKAAIFAASKSGLFAIVANGGASLVASRWFDTTTWQGAHHRRAGDSLTIVWVGAKRHADPAVAAIKIAKLKPQPRILPPRTANSPSARAPQAAQQPPRRKAASVMSAACDRCSPESGRPCAILLCRGCAKTGMHRSNVPIWSALNHAAHEIHLVAFGSAFRRLGSISAPHWVQTP